MQEVKMDKKIYIEKVQAQIREWEAKLDLLHAKADKATADTKINYMKQIDKLKQQKSHVEEQLAEIRDAGEDLWEDIKDKLDTAQEEMRGILHKIFSKKETQDKNQETLSEE